jgi:hypothetical protein
MFYFLLLHQRYRNIARRYSGQDPYRTIHGNNLANSRKLVILLPSQSYGNCTLFDHQAPRLIRLVRLTSSQSLSGRSSVQGKGGWLLVPRSGQSKNILDRTPTPVNRCRRVTAPTDKIAPCCRIAQLRASDIPVNFAKPKGKIVGAQTSRGQAEAPGSVATAMSRPSPILTYRNRISSFVKAARPVLLTLPLLVSGAWSSGCTEVSRYSVFFVGLTSMFRH